MTDSKNFPIFSRADLTRRTDRGVHEMLGMVRGIVCDGIVTEGEVKAFQNWLSAHPDETVCWPGNVLAERIIRIVSDGKVDAVEQHELYELFCDTVGEGDISKDEPQSFSTRLPFDDPPPAIIFPEHLFCFTGAFVYGTRSQCEHSTILRGGVCKKTIVKQPMTLVIGGHANDAWIHSTFGRKIEEAMDHRQEGVPIAIVSEECWTTAVMRAPVIISAGAAV